MDKKLDKKHKKLTDEKEMRAELAKDFKLRDIPNSAWKSLIRKGLVRPPMTKGDAEWEDLILDTEELLELRKDVLEEAGAWRRQRTRQEKPELSVNEKARVEALGEYTALHAALDSHVWHFRKGALEGQLLTPEQAYEFMYSPANQCFPITWFLEQRISIRDHYSSYPKYYNSYQENWDKDEEGNPYRFHDIYMEPPGESFRKIVYEPLDEDDRDSLSFPITSDFAHGAEAFPVEAGSVLDVLRRICDRLVKAFGHAWKEHQAAWFVLTGEATPAVALDGQTDIFFGDEMTRGTITLRAEPWVPAETILRYYRRMQKNMLEHKDNRPLSDKSLALFRFVIGHYRDVIPDVEKSTELTASSQLTEWEINLTPTFRMDLDGNWEVDLSPFTGTLEEVKLTRRPSWRTLYERWNQSHTKEKWSYSDVRNFRRAFLEVARVLLIPPYEDDLVLEFVDVKNLLP